MRLYKEWLYSIEYLLRWLWKCVWKGHFPGACCVPELVSYFSCIVSEFKELCIFVCKAMGIQWWIFPCRMAWIQSLRAHSGCHEEEVFGMEEVRSRRPLWGKQQEFPELGQQQWGRSNLGSSWVATCKGLAFEKIVPIIFVICIPSVQHLWDA